MQLANWRKFLEAELRPLVRIKKPQTGRGMGGWAGGQSSKYSSDPA